MHKQPFVTTHFHFITAHFVRRCALKMPCDVYKLKAAAPKFLLLCKT